MLDPRYDSYGNKLFPVFCHLFTVFFRTTHRIFRPGATSERGTSKLITQVQLPPVSLGFFCLVFVFLSALPLLKRSRINM